MKPLHPDVFAEGVGFLIGGLVAVALIIVVARWTSARSGQGVAVRASVITLLTVIAVCGVLVGLWLLMASYSTSFGR